MSIQDYQLLSKLGEGSFGIVHKARQKKNNTICVVKIVDISKMNAKLRKIAIDQGKILKQANSQFIVQHFNTFVNKQKLYIVMQYCPKGDLANFIKSQMGKPLKQETVWKFSIQMMGGLRDLHGKKILHRDIKTLNVFLDQNCNAKIGDLGVAKTMTSDFAHTIVGTPYYLSPQMCQQKPYNQKTDIWAMGCIIYELCTGKRPFQANNQAALALKIVMGKYDNLPSHYSTDLTWVVKSCLSVDYKRRPTAAYLLQMPKTKQWATKLNISLESQPIKSNNISKQIQKQKQLEKIPIKKQIEEKKPQIKKQISTPRVSKASGFQSVKNKSKQKPKQKEKPVVQKIKLSKEAERNVKQVLNNKVLENKPTKYSGAKRFQMKSQQERQKKQEKSKQQTTKQKQQIKPINPKIPKPAQVKIVQKPVVDTKQYVSQPSFPTPIKNKDAKQKLMNATMNRFLPQNYKKKRQIDLQDQSKIEEVQLLDSDSSEQREKNQIAKANKQTNKKVQIFQNAQQMVNDDQLMQQFGLAKQNTTSTKQKKQQKAISKNVGGFQLDKKPISINWNQFSNQTQTQKAKNKRPLPQLPTIRTASSKQLQPLMQMKFQPQQEQQTIEQQINENRPYISDQQNQNSRQQNQDFSNNQQFQQQKSQQLLIEDIDQKQQDLYEKLSQNQKRKKQLQKMKQFLQPQLLKMMSKAQYEKLKIKVIDCKEDQVQQFVASWRNNIQSMNLFYRIIHFDMEIKRCQANLKLIQNRLEDIRKQKL